jgi:competence protein CoiA
MLFALVDGEKVEAKPNTQGKCQLCESDVFSKCGEINDWHWAHFKDESCDSWYEPESEWHKNWKLIFGKENCEIIISKDGIRHIADIQTKENVIIELQNSPIPKPIIRQRESFYGEQMIWIINGLHFKNNFKFYPPGTTISFRSDNKSPDRHGIFINNIQETTPHLKNEVNFSWDWARKSWCDVQRYVFIDFGDETLFWVMDGMGTSGGKGKHITKEIFIKKYGGDLELIETLIDKSNKSSHK